jgi:hypothetical protein
VLYTDDCLLFARDDDTISDLCQSLSTKFLLKDEGDIAGFLGIQINHAIAPNGSINITMTQPGLIDQILEDVGLVGDRVTRNALQQHKYSNPIRMQLLLMPLGTTILSLEN